MTYSFDDKIITRFTIKLAQKDKDGKVVKSLDQEVTVSIRP